MTIPGSLVGQVGFLSSYLPGAIPAINNAKEIYNKIVAPGIILIGPIVPLYQKTQCQSEMKRLSKKIHVLKNVLRTLPEDRAAAVKVQIQKLKGELKQKKGLLKNLLIKVGLFPGALFVSPAASAWNSLVEMTNKAMCVSESISPSSLSLEAIGSIVSNTISLAGTSALFMSQLNYVDESNPISAHLQNAALGVSLIEGALAAHSTYQQFFPNPDKK